MKRTTRTASLLLPLSLAALPLCAAVPTTIPIQWIVNTSHADHHAIEQFSGTSIDLEATLMSSKGPLMVEGEPLLYWQTNGMGRLWFHAPATASNNVLRAAWTPACETGGETFYKGFIGIPGSIYSAAFTLRLRPSPGAVPNALPLPAPRIDFAAVEVANAPWVEAETDPTVPAWAKAAEKPAYTASEVGAYTKAEADAKVNAATNGLATKAETKTLGNRLDWMSLSVEGLDLDLAAHAADTNNPHAVTAAQVGAYTQDETDERIGEATGGLATSDALVGVRETAGEALAYARASFLYLSGNTNAWLQGTNYVFGSEATNRASFAWEDGMDAASVPCSMALWELRDGVRRPVWDQRDWTVWYWNFKIGQYRGEHDGRDAALRALVAQRSPLAWASHTACGLTNAAGDTTWLDTPKVVLSAGYAWQHVAEAGGVGYWGIRGNGFEVGGSGTNATLQITDFEGKTVLKIVKGGSRLAPVTSESAAGSGFDGTWMWYGMKTGDDARAPQPVGEFSADLLDTFVPEGDGCPAEVREYAYTSNGVWRCYFRLRPGIASDACFARFKVATAAETTVEYAAPQTISGGLIYGGVKIRPVIPDGAKAGDEVVWKVVQ